MLVVCLIEMVPTKIDRIHVRMTATGPLDDYFGCPFLIIIGNLGKVNLNRRSFRESGKHKLDYNRSFILKVMVPRTILALKKQEVTSLSSLSTTSLL